MSSRNLFHLGYHLYDKRSQVLKKKTQYYMGTISFLRCKLTLRPAFTTDIPQRCSQKADLDKNISPAEHILRN